MRLLYIARARIPTEKAHGLQIVKMCEAFAKIGIDVELVIPFRIQTRVLKGRNAFEYYNVKRIFDIKKLPAPDLIYFTSFLKGRLGIALFHAHSFIFSILALIYSLIKNPDIIFTRDSKIAYLLSFFKPVIYESHAFPSSKIEQYFERSAFRRCKFFIVITRNLKDIYKKNNFDENKIYILPDCVDIEKFDISVSKEEARKKLNLDTNEKIVVYTGHLYPWKGIYTLLEASRFLNAMVVLVGGLEEDVNKVKEYIKTNNIDNVLIVGHVEPEMVPVYLKAADVLVLPNSAKDLRSVYYTSPLKLFEYMASKRPIVASDLPSIKEILNEENAILVEPDNPKALADGINKVLNDTKFAESIAENAYCQVTKYTWDERSRAVLEIYTQKKWSR